MKKNRKVRIKSDVRPLTEEAIQKLSDHGLKAYRTKVLALRESAHEILNIYCCGERCPTVIGQEEATPRQATRIRKMDFLAAACNREWKKRQLGRKFS